MLSWGLLIAVACAVFFYKAAEIDESSPIIWTGLSILVYVLSRFLLPFGLVGVILGQVLLFFGIAIVRVLFARKD